MTINEPDLSFDVLARSATSAETVLRALLPRPVGADLPSEVIVDAIDTLGVGLLTGSQRFDLPDAIPEIRHAIELDVAAAVAIDPSCAGTADASLNYPGVHAVAVYRLAHWLWTNGLRTQARLLATYARRTTSIDIHPGASIGRSFFIDHGVGVVVGETTHVGNHVTLYQGVTLGALKVERSTAGVKRHPTIEDYVTIYANATILGGETVIGAGCVIAAGVFVTDSVPARHIVRNSKPTIELRPRAKDLPLSFAI